MKTPRNIAASVVRTEMESLARLAESFTEDFDRVVDLILRSPGRLVVSGIGKSANVAAKIVATLNSTGTPAIFMHAADATHGDLGIVGKDDMVLIISKSGNTPEIKLLASLVKNYGFPVIAMTADKDSYLARRADYLLYTPVEREADPFNLVPTTSTTVQMAMGDALAIAILEKRHFTRDDFAKNHPGGTIGKRLLLKVGDVLIPQEPPSVPPDAPVPRIIHEITAKRVGATAVTENGRIKGIITDGDIRRMLTRNPRIDRLVAADILSPRPKTIREDALAVEALKKMKSLNINQLIVLDREGNYRGIVHMHDILKEGIL
ncbi:MAG: KpsF/GutQ family sugar-phosphate isomerase [Chlorobi bacterium]|nr:KpsF/GutQ family sugar-phosphate isomerase [Chlorobiota bacterium]